MGTPEAGGNQGTPHNQDHEHFKALKDQGRLRPNSTEPKEIFQVFYGKPPEGAIPGDAHKYLPDPHFRGFAKPMRPAVFGGHERPSRRRRDNTQLPEKRGEQRGEADPSQPNLVEQQARGRLGKPFSESGEQEIDALAPSYLDNRSRFVFPVALTPKRTCFLNLMAGIAWQRFCWIFPLPA